MPRAAPAPDRARVVRRLQAKRQAVSVRRLHGPLATGRVQLAARVLPGDDLPDLLSRHGRRLRRASGLPRPRGAAVGHGHRSAAAAGFRWGLGGSPRARPLRCRVGRKRRDGLARQGREPRLRPDRDATHLEGARDRGCPRARLRNGPRRNAAADRARRQARRRNRGQRRLRRGVHLALEPRPLAARLGRRSCSCSRSSTTWGRTSSSAPGSGSRPAHSSELLPGWLSPACLRCTRPSRTPSRGRTARLPAGSSSCCGSTTAPGPCSSAPS